MNLDLNALLPMLQAGDLDAIALVYQQYRHRLYRFAIGVCNCSPEDAEDVVQDAFMVLSAKLAGREFLEQGFLFGLIYNLCRALRRKKKGGQLPDSDDLQDREPGAEAVAVKAEEQQQLMHAIARLPPELREVVVLYHFEELTMEQVKVRLGVALGTVHHRLQKALTWLRRLLADGDDG